MIANKMEEAFKKVSDIDFDLRFMGAQDLCEILDDDKSNLDEDQKVRILEVFIKQLDDGNKEVKSHAVRCISKTLYRINEISLKKAIDKIFDNFVKEDIDIYSVCLKTIVNNVEFNLGTELCTNCLPRLHFYLTDSSASESAVEQCLDILHSILRKYSQIIRQNANLTEIVSRADILLRSQCILLLCPRLPRKRFSCNQENSKQLSRVYGTFLDQGPAPGIGDGTF